MSGDTGTPDEASVWIFDTTLRDGEQAPGCTMTRDEKLEVARQLARLRVDVIEAGFPAASPGDWEAVHAIAREVGTPEGPVICGLARANARDIDCCWSAIEPAAKPRIHTFIATSDLHLEHKLRMSRAQVVDAVAAMVCYARSLCPDVEFSPEDAGRSDPEFLHEVLAIAVECGATTLNIPDTVGYTTPEEYGAIIAGIRAHVSGVERAVLSTHCHDDLGLAVANSLAGVRAGARQVECTINGIGERAGNASLEEVVMALHARRRFFAVVTAVDTCELARTSRLVSACTGVRVPPNKAIVGANAFAHEAGIHQDGVLKNPLTYEIMRADTVGWDGSTLVLGKHSGRHALRTRLEALGHRLDDDELQRVFARFKEVADKKKVVEERDLEALVADEIGRPPALYALEGVQVTCGTHAIPVATVRLRGPDGVTRTESAQGTGPVDAVCLAINRIAGDPGELVGCTVDAVTEGLNAIGQVTVRVRQRAEPSAEPEARDTAGGAGARGRERICTGHSANLDIIVAAADAYLAVVNKIAQERRAAGSEAPGLTPAAPYPPASPRVTPAHAAATR